MNSSTLYLDYCATTPMEPRVLDAMLPYFTTHFGNASSHSHAFGWEAQEAVSQAQHEIALLLGCSSQDMVLTSGATESNNLAIQGMLRLQDLRGQHLITSAIEHKSVLDCCRAMQQAGAALTILPVNREGQVTTESLQQAMRPTTRLVSIMAANNETGVIQPIEQLSQIAHQGNALFHCDLTQFVGKVPIDLTNSQIDLASFSAHKIYGPKGIGGLYVRRGVQLAALMFGGGHQAGRRSGTSPVPLIVGFGKACEVARRELDDESRRNRALRDILEQTVLANVTGACINGHPQQRLPHVTNLRIPGIDAEELLVELETVACSTGAACSSASGQPSHVLTAMGLSREQATSSLRLSVGRGLTRDDVVRAAHDLIEALRQSRLSESVTLATTCPAFDPAIV